MLVFKLKVNSYKNLILQRRVNDVWVRYKLQFPNGNINWNRNLILEKRVNNIRVEKMLLPNQKINSDKNLTP